MKFTLPRGQLMRAKIGKVREVVQSTIARGKVENVVHCNVLRRSQLARSCFTQARR
jgi:hypothetical protein